MALISLSFKKIYKPTNNNLQTSSNTSRANQDNSLRINRGTGYDNQRAVNVVGARENMECQKPKQVKDAAYHKEKMLLCKQEEARVQLNAEQANWKDDTGDESEDQELEAHYMYMAQIQEVTPDPDDTDDLDQERDLLASLIQKLKCEIDDNKNRNKFLESSNKALVDKLKDLKKFQAELDKYNDVNYASKVEIDCAKAKGDLIFAKPEFLKKAQRANPRLYDIGVIPTTSVSRPQLKSNQLEDRVMPNNSQGKKQNVEDHHRNFKFSNNKTSITACNDSLNAKTSNVNFVCVTCGKCVLNDNHDLCVLHYINGVNSRTRQPMAVPISTREPKHNVNQSVATSTHRDNPIHRRLWCSKHMTRNLKLLTNFVEKFMRTVKFRNDQIAPILGYGDLVQGTITIKQSICIYTSWLSPLVGCKDLFSLGLTKGLNHNLFTVGQFCDADLEVAFRKSTCYIRNLKGNDLLTGSRGTDLYSITLQDSSTPNLICLMAKATSSQAWLWHRRLSYLNFDTINLLSKNNIVNGLLKLKFIKDHLCSSCELGKAKRKSFHTKTTPSSKRRLQLLHMDLCGPMRVESINGKKYVLVIVDDYSRYTWTYFLRSKDETPGVLIDFLTLVQRGLHA
ncbi:retrovirus-related pol polyprotein from transposon TNT 1-94 [Tanacetum coccineum]